MEGKGGKRLIQSPCTYKRVRGKAPVSRRGKAPVSRRGKTTMSHSNKENTLCPNAFLWDTSDDDDDDVLCQEPNGLKNAKALPRPRPPPRSKGQISSSPSSSSRACAPISSSNQLLRGSGSSSEGFTDAEFENFLVRMKSFGEKKTLSLSTSSLDCFIVEDHIELSGNEDVYHPALSVLATSGVESRGNACLLSRSLPDNDSPVSKGPLHPVLHRNNIRPSHQGGSPLLPTSRGTPTPITRPHLPSHSNAKHSPIKPSSGARVQGPPTVVRARFESPTSVLSDSSSDGEFESLLLRIRRCMGSNHKPGVVRARFESPTLVLSDSSSVGELESLPLRIRGCMSSNHKPGVVRARFESPTLVLSDSSSDGELESLPLRIRGCMGSNHKPVDQSIFGCSVSSEVAGNGVTEPTTGASKKKNGESSRLLPLKQPVQRDERGALAVSLTCPVTRPARPHSTPTQKKPSHNKRGKRTASDVVTEFKPVLSEASQDDHIGRVCKFPGCFLLEMVSQSSLAVRHFRQSRQSRQDLTVRLYCLYNDSVFEGKLPDDMPVTWNRKLRKTAGKCISSFQFGKNRSRCARIELSEKVCDTADRLRDTLIHEMCHAASWLLYGIRDGHGQIWQLFANKACLVHPELPPITRCHSYQIRYKFYYRCTSCQNSIGRHSKSLDVNRFHCRLCGGSLRLESPGGTPCRTAPLAPFAQFVKDKFAETRKANLGKGHGEVMRLLSEAFSTKLRLQSAGNHS